MTPRTCGSSVSGMDVDLLEPKPEQILLGDIAHSLARVARFVGHTTGDVPWNVAQHSLLVEQLIPEDAAPADRLRALLHDAHEAYVGDMVSPVKWALDAESVQAYVRMGMMPSGMSPSAHWNTIVARLDAAIHAAFGLAIPDGAVAAAIKTADLTALAVEKELFMSPSRRPWSILPPLPDPMPVVEMPLAPRDAALLFLGRFHELMDARHGLN